MIETIYDVSAITSQTKVTCDSCGETVVADSFEGLLEEIKERGWTNTREHDDWVNYCIDCIEI